VKRANPDSGPVPSGASSDVQLPIGERLPYACGLYGYC
jgi:hypothetical protein